MLAIEQSAFPVERDPLVCEHPFASGHCAPVGPDDLGPKIAVLVVGFQHLGGKFGRDCDERDGRDGVVVVHLTWPSGLVFELIEERLARLDGSEQVVACQRGYLLAVLGESVIVGEFTDPVGGGE